MSEDNPSLGNKYEEIGLTAEDVRITERHYMSLSHIRAGALCARRAGEIEQKYKKGGETGENTSSEEHKAYVISSVVSTVSFLESLINELITDISEDDSQRMDDEFKESDLESNIKKAEKQYSVVMRHSPLEKYQLTLLLANEDLFETGEQPYQNVSTLKNLRNYLVHYTPEDAQARPKPENPDIKMGERLKNKNFDLNPLVSEGNTFFPSKCLSHGCASWGVNRALAFTDEFYSRLGADPPYEHIRDDIYTDPD